MRFKNYVMPIAIGLFICQSAYALDFDVTPNREIIEVNDGEYRTSAETGSYLYEDYNYYKLRDICGLIGYDVEWSAETRAITVVKTGETAVETTKTDDAKSISMAKSEIKFDGRKRSFDCLNIDGYNYFKLRELADFMGFSADWDGKGIIITLSGEKAEEKPMRFALNYVNEDIKQEIVDSKGIAIDKDVPDYSALEKYIRENIDENFALDDYIVTLADETKLAGVYIVTLRFDVNGIPANFGYRVICEEGYAKIINFNGEMNPNFDAAELPEKLISDEEAKARAIDDNDSKYTVVGQKVSRYFDMESLKFVCSVETEYMDKGGATVVKENKYFE